MGVSQSLIRAVAAMMAVVAAKCAHIGQSRVPNLFVNSECMLAGS
jgi:hypothetical protein